MGARGCYDSVRGVFEGTLYIRLGLRGGGWLGLRGVIHLVTEINGFV